MVLLLYLIMGQYISNCITVDDIEYDDINDDINDDIENDDIENDDNMRRDNTTTLDEWAEKIKIFSLQPPSQVADKLQELYNNYLLYIDKSDVTQIDYQYILKKSPNLIKEFEDFIDVLKEIHYFKKEHEYIYAPEHILTLFSNASQYIHVINEKHIGYIQCDHTKQQFKQHIERLKKKKTRNMSVGEIESIREGIDKDIKTFHHETTNEKQIELDLARRAFPSFILENISVQEYIDNKTNWKNYASELLGNNPSDSLIMNVLSLISANFIASIHVELMKIFKKTMKKIMKDSDILPILPLIPPQGLHDMTKFDFNKETQHGYIAFKQLTVSQEFTDIHHGHFSKIQNPEYYIEFKINFKIIDGVMNPSTGDDFEITKSIIYT